MPKLTTRQPTVREQLSRRGTVPYPRSWQTLERLNAQGSIGHKQTEHGGSRWDVTQKGAALCQPQFHDTNQHAEAAKGWASGEGKAKVSSGSIGALTPLPSLTRRRRSSV